jgi:hypothetical protein
MKPGPFSNSISSSSKRTSTSGSELLIVYNSDEDYCEAQSVNLIAEKRLQVSAGQS